MEKLDLYKKHKSEYVTPRQPVLIIVGPAKYLSVDGVGAPESEQFQQAIAALYQMAWTIKMTKKFAGQDYKVCNLEGLWWGLENMPPRDEWRWKLIIRVPDFIKAADLREALATLKKKGKPEPAAKVRLETIREGRCVQVLHVGPYGDEPSTIARMKTFSDSQKLSFACPHHEIYISDPRRVAPEKLRTILRMPVK